MQIKSISILCSTLAISAGLFSCKSDALDCGPHGSAINNECSCEAGYTGQLCETFDKCLLYDTDCHGYPCEDGVCQCADGFMGEDCSQFNLESLYGTYHVIRYTTSDEQPDFELKSLQLVHPDSADGLGDYDKFDLWLKEPKGFYPGNYGRGVRWEATSFQDIQWRLDFDLAGSSWDAYEMDCQGHFQNDTLYMQGEYVSATWSRGGPRPGVQIKQTVSFAAIRCSGDPARSGGVDPCP